MSLPAFAELPALILEVGDQPDDERCEALLARVSTAIRAETRRTFVDDDGVLVDDDEIRDYLASVTVQVAARAVRNPKGAVQETTGPYSTSHGPAAADGIYFTKLERTQLAAAVAALDAIDSTSAGIPGLGILRTTRGQIETRTVLTQSDTEWDPDGDDEW